jgi:hypothetical protein
MEYAIANSIVVKKVTYKSCKKLTGFAVNDQDGVKIITKIIASNTNAATVESNIANAVMAIAAALTTAGFRVSAAKFQPPSAKFIANPNPNPAPTTAIPTANPTQSPTQFIKPGSIAAAVLLTLFGVFIILIGVFFYRRRNISAEVSDREPVVDIFQQEPISDFGVRGYEPQTTTVKSPVKVDAIPTPTAV